jgi:hypothetical protein
MTTPFPSTAAPSAAVSPVRSSSIAPAAGPSLAEAMSALRPEVLDHTPWHVRERWLVVLLASFLPITGGLVLTGTPRVMLLVTAGLLIAIGLGLLVVHELRGRNRR